MTGVTGLLGVLVQVKASTHAPYLDDFMAVTPGGSDLRGDSSTPGPIQYHSDLSQTADMAVKRYHVNRQKFACRYSLFTLRKHRPQLIHNRQ